MADTVTAQHFSIHTDDDADVEDDDEDQGSHRSSVSRLSLSVYNSEIKHLEEDGDGVEEEEEDGERSVMAQMSQLSLQNSSEVDGDEEFFYDSDREVGERGIGSGNLGRRRKEAMRGREQWLERVWGMRRKRKEGGGGCGEEHEMMDQESGESECVVIAKPKGGERRLFMDMDEMKACEDLGFELQPEWTLELPRGMSLSSIDTDSGRNSPLANFRISSPG
ncbi:hypothetical protein ACLOJK_022181 [Asimina triloba]